MTKPKVGDRRPSTMCPKWCEAKGCYDEYRQMTGMLSPYTKNPKPYRAWTGHCKSLNKLTKGL